MKPILLTTPRTGSTIIQRLLCNLAIQHFGYKGNMLEPFTITELFRAKYVRENDVVTIADFERLGYKWFNDKREIKLNFLKLIENDYNYMIKMFPIDMEPEIQQVLENEFDVIFLERRDKVHQALSWVLLWETNISHYKVHDERQVESLTYNPFHAREMIRHLKAYKEFKESYKKPYKVLVYEDFMALGGNEDALIRLLNIPITEYKKLQMPTKPTPYKHNLEEMIINKDEWYRDKPFILAELENC